MYEEEMPQIRRVCLESTSTDPIRIAKRLMALPEVPVNGPVHHLADGAALLAAIRNAGANLRLLQAQRRLHARALSLLSRGLPATGLAVVRARPAGQRHAYTRVALFREVVGRE